MSSMILVVDDDPLICKGLKFNLEKEGYTVVTATNSRMATEQVQSGHFKAVILDIGLPGDDGLGLCHYLKSHFNLPVIFLTGRRRELDEIIGLEVGGDDYITKPFSIDILLARLKAVLRRAKAEASASLVPEQQEVKLGEFYLDPLTHTALLDDAPLSLAPREFDLLHFFLRNPERIFTTEEIVEGVWGVEYIGEPQVVYVQIRSLREKIESDPSNPTHLITLRKVGYKFVP